MTQWKMYAGLLGLFSIGNAYVGGTSFEVFAPALAALFCLAVHSILIAVAKR